MKIRWHIYTGFPGATYKGEFDVEPDITDDEIDEYVCDQAWNYISVGWEKVEESAA